MSSIFPLEWFVRSMLVEHFPVLCMSNPELPYLHLFAYAFQRFVPPFFQANILHFITCQSPCRTVLALCEGRRPHWARHSGHAPGHVFQGGAEFSRCVAAFSGFFSRTAAFGHYARWRPSQVGWRPSLLGWRPMPLVWRPSQVAWRPSLVGNS